MTTVAIPRTLGVIPLDVVVREQHESDMQITTNRVEAGSDIADHAYALPKRVTLEAVMGGMGQILSAASVMASYEALVSLQETREPFDVVTGLRVYRNMLIERITVNRDAENARVLWFSADLTEVVIVDTETTSGGTSSKSGGAGTKGGGQANTSAKKSAPGIPRDKASPDVNRGNKTVQDAPATGTTTEAVKNRSLLKQLFEGS